MENAKHKRSFALLLCAALMFSQPGTTVYAEEAQADTGGLCEHHPQHTAECGYKEARPGHPCSHKHMADCYTDTLVCGFDGEEVQTASGSDAPHEHTRECYKLDCPHEHGEHDKDCGYMDTVKGYPCGYVCDACKTMDSGREETVGKNMLFAPEKTEQKTMRQTGKPPRRITDFDTLDTEVQNRLVPAGTEWEALALPVKLGTKGYILADDIDPQPEPLTVEGITWEIDPDHELNDGNGTYSPEIGSYCLTPVLPEGYELDYGVMLPEIYVMIDGPMDLTGQNLHTVYIYLEKDGSSWSDSGKTFCLTEDDGETFLTDLEAVPDGTYEIWESTSTPSGMGLFVTVNQDVAVDINYYTVTFYDGDTPYTTDGLEPQIVLKGKNAEKPEERFEPVKDGYTFNRWVTENGGNSEFLFDSPDSRIQRKTNVYADWIRQVYDPADVAAFQALMEDFPSAFSRLDRVAPDTWGKGVQPVVTWSVDQPKQITGLDLSAGLAEKLTGRLDVSVLTNLTELNCSRNNLTSLILPGRLVKLNCEDNSLRTLDVSRLNLAYLLCGANPLNVLTLPGSKELEVQSARGGTVSLDEIIYHPNNKTRIKLRAEPDSGYFLKEWLDQNGAVKGTDEALEIVLSGLEYVIPVFAKAVTVKVRKDGTEWTDHGRSYRITADGGITFITDISTAPNGVYDIWEGNTDTGVKVTVDQGGAFAEIDYYTVVFADGNVEYNSGPWAPQIVLSGKKALVPAGNPVKKGYRFLGWVTEDGGKEAFSFEDPVRETTKIYASWELAAYAVLTDSKPSSQCGTVTANKNQAVEGSTVELTAAAKSGYRFKEWRVNQGGAVLKSMTGNPTTFSMPAQDVEIYGVFEEIPAAQYQVKVSGSYASETGEGSYSAGETVTVRAGTRNGYRFAGWTSGDRVNFSDTSKETAAFLMPEKNVTVTANWKADGGVGSSSGSGSSSSGSSYQGVTTTVTTQEVKDASGNVTGSTGAVSTSNITTSENQENAIVTVTPDASVINKVAGAVGVSAENPIILTAVIPRDIVVNELQKPEVSGVSVNVVIPKSVKDNQTVRISGVTIEKEAVEAARQSGKRLETVVRDDTGAVDAVWSLDGQTMQSASGESTDLTLGVHVAPVQSDDRTAVPVKPTVAATDRDNGLVITVTANGTLLSSAKLTVPATVRTDLASGTAVALYQFDHSTGTLRPVSGGSYTVDANGYVTVDISSGTRTGAAETYVLLANPVAGLPAAGNGTNMSYTVQKGDTLNKLSAQYGCSVAELMALNPGLDIYNLQIGSSIVVPAR